MQLPQELVDEIINMTVPPIGEDGWDTDVDGALKSMPYNFCLVSRAFLPRSRALLWHRLRSDDYLAFQSLQQHNHLPCLVNTLIIDSDQPCLKDIEVLTHIVHLELHGHIGYIPKEVVNHIREHWSGLRTVSFVQAYFVANVMGLLRKLPMIKEFRFLSSDGPSFGSHKSLRNVDWDQPVAHLDTLHLNIGKDILPLIRAVVSKSKSMFSIDSVRNLTLGVNDYRAPAVTACAFALLDAVAPALEQLAFRFLPDRVRHMDCVDLTSFRKLRSLSFDILEKRYMPGPRAAAAWWTKNLREAISKRWTIQEIEVNVILYGDRLDPEGGIFHGLHNAKVWQALDEILGQVDAKSVALRIRSHGRLDDKDVTAFKEALSKYLPVCLALPHFVFRESGRFWHYY
ncbi:hypothetical protein CYLTODRAFT_423941 [Cylindrobasidium torrendii FP15055 ss-10]|uniref:F-box domain-containing protein n=1 Tax=Cylindrobasidium torrendii FP15055 ss-10 TaxID=1314674 RepID=A0A0D7B8L9_9AGAR|nr:hypothetical protein CYLTODRAFT_423941 [Cylindrobasidium torrendii FP15055 ss-10]